MAVLRSRIIAPIPNIHIPTFDFSNVQLHPCLAFNVLGMLQFCYTFRCHLPHSWPDNICMFFLLLIVAVILYLVGVISWHQFLIIDYLGFCFAIQQRSDTVDLTTDTTLMVDISDALSERDKVKFTVHTKVLV